MSLEEENKYRDQIAIQAILRVAALERVLIANGLVNETDLFSELSKLSKDLVNVIKDLQKGD